MSAKQHARPTTGPSTNKAKCHRGGRRPVTLSEAALEQALVAGLEHCEIARQFGCSVRTVRRRIEQARRVHGRAWPVSAKIPPPKPAPEPLPDRDFTRAELERLARQVHAHAMRGGEVKNTALAAARTIMQTPPTTEPPAHATESHAALLERLRSKAKALTPDEVRPQLRVVDAESE